MIWDERIETADRKTIEAIQLDRLQHTVATVYENVPFYKEQFDEYGIQPSDIHTLRDISKLPFTTKDDMRANYPYGMLAVPLKDVIRIHASSGTTGSSTVVGYTREDMENWTELVARMVYQAGGSADDIAQISFGYGLFTGGFGLHYGLERVGASVIPVSSGNTKRQIQIMQDFGTTMLISTPSYALYLSEAAESMGIDPAGLGLRLGMFGGEGHSNEMRAQLEKRWDMLVTENYGLSEIMGPGVAGECTYKDGMHIAEDHFLFEIIDPDTGEVLPAGEKGEVVITTLSKVGLPLIRYRTKDISRLIYEPCRCGRTSVRLEKLSGRSDDMLVIRGVNVFPSQIESVLLGFDNIGPNYEIIVSRENYLDKLEIMVEVDASLLEKFADLESLAKRIKDAIRQDILIDVKLTMVNPSTLKRFEGKAQRVTDLRGESDE